MLYPTIYSNIFVMEIDMKNQIKRPVALAVASSFLDGIALTCYDLFQNPQFKKCFSELRQCIDDMYQLGEYDVTAIYMTMEYEPWQKKKQ